MKPQGLLVLTVALVGSACSSPKKLTESQEYYVGRGLAANAILKDQGLSRDLNLEDYVTLVGLSVALESDRPETYRGYHFGVLNSPQINAFAAPSGFIFVTVGALKLMENEDELAGVLGHEIAHVNLRHPEEAANKATQKTGIMETEAFAASAASTLFQVLGKKQAQDAVKTLAPAFSKALDDFTEGVIVNGYGRASELEADAKAADLVSRVGYDPTALRRFIAKLPKVDRGAWGTHPELEGRLKSLDEAIEKLKNRPALDPARADRFKAATAGLRGQ
jgi:predicted Zn-dependent protease